MRVRERERKLKKKKKNCEFVKSFRFSVSGSEGASRIVFCSMIKPSLNKCVNLEFWDHAIREKKINHHFKELLTFE